MYLLTEFSSHRVLATAASLALALVSAAHVQAANTITQVAPADLGGHNVIAMGVDGFPVIAHLQLRADTAGASLFITKCGNVDCTANSTTSLVDDRAAANRIAPPAGNSLSIVVSADGLPAISYLTGPDFKVVKCGNPACSAGNVLTVLSSDLQGINEYPISTSITLSPQTGLPIIAATAFVQTAHSNFIFVCNTANCSSATQSQIGGDTYYLYAGSMTAGRDGFPVFSYFTHSGSSADRYKLMVLKCGNAYCSAGNTATEVDPANSPVTLGRLRVVAPVRSSIAIGADGFPVISYVTYPIGVVNPRDSTATVLMVAKCVNAGCTSGTRISTVDSSSAQVGEANSISVPADGRPVVSYYDRTGKMLKVAKCGNADCSSHNTVNAVDTKVVRHFGEYTNEDEWLTYPGIWSSMVVPTDGRPIISYSDQDGLSSGVVLKVLKCGNASCQP